ncbi:MAG: acetate--CoA ligase family protein [Planctomycetes bacterium]|nr:acetate--CoA ligase family protein [Planctomycetota bacterium]
MTKNIDTVFNPQSVAVLGATRTKGTVPHDILQNILDGGFQGVVYPVSPRSPSINGVKAYKYILEIEDPVDLAILVFPSSVCHLALEQCGEKGVKACIIISAGFREVGPAGVEREKNIKEIAAKYGISLIGPNCLGAINTDPSVSLNASFARKMPQAGSIAFLSQSGALCTAVLDYARGKNIGFSKFVSFGNKSDISEIDLIYYLGKDEATKVILIYLEEITDGQKLLEAAQTVIKETGKPILAIKSGRTSAGASAAASHTGSLAGSDEVCDAIFRQAGIKRCHTIEEMFNIATALAYQPRPLTNRVAIVTNAGGPGVMATDACIDHGLELASFSEETTEIFRRKLPKTANIYNPVDVIGDARSDRYNAALAGVLSDPNVAGAMVILTPQSMTDIDEIAREIVRTSAANPGKPVYTSFMGETDVASGINILQSNHIPHYILPESMAAAMAASYNFEQALKIKRLPVEPAKDVDKKKAQKLLKAAADAGHKHLPEVEATQVLAAYGLPVLPSFVATTAAEAAKFANQVGFPVAMKIYSPDVVHKFDVGGVILDVADADSAGKAFEQIVASVKKAQPKAEITGVNIQKMAPHGREVILGLKRDPIFGPVVMFGLGGTFVEVFKDVSFRAAPLDSYAVGAMIREIKSFPILAGARGRTACDLAAIEDCIKRLAQLAVDCPEIIELDMNPVIVQPEGEGAVVADARIML